VLVKWLADRVEVGHAMVHGGPYPSTSDGPARLRLAVLHPAISAPCIVTRTCLPLCCPTLLRDGNPLGLWRRIDGVLGSK